MPVILIVWWQGSVVASASNWSAVDRRAAPSQPTAPAPAWTLSINNGAHSTAAPPNVADSGAWRKRLNHSATTPLAGIPRWQIYNRWTCSKAFLKLLWVNITPLDNNVANISKTFCCKVFLGPDRFEVARSSNVYLAFFLNLGNCFMYYLLCGNL